MGIRRPWPRLCEVCEKKSPTRAATIPSLGGVEKSLAGGVVFCCDACVPPSLGVGDYLTKEEYESE